MLASVWSLDVGMVCGGVDIAVGDDCGTRMLSVVGGWADSYSSEFASMLNCRLHLAVDG